MDNIKNISDGHLFDLIKRGNKEAFKELYNRFSGVLYLHALRMLRNEEEARDVVQELFISLWEKRDRVIIKAVSSYLYSSTRNRVLDKISKEKNKTKYLESIKFYQENYTHEVPDRILYHKELKELIESEVEKLPEKMKAVFCLSRYEYLTHKQIGDKLGISESTVKKQVNNALKILKSKFGHKYIKNILIFIYSLLFY